MNANPERLSVDLKDAIQNAETILKETAKDASDKARVARERLQAAIQSARGCCQSLQGKAVEGAKAADKLIRQHPYQSIGIALGLGFLAGYLITRK